MSKRTFAEIERDELTESLKRTNSSEEELLKRLLEVQRDPDGYSREDYKGNNNGPKVLPSFRGVFIEISSTDGQETYLFATARSISITFFLGISVKSI